MKYLKLYEEFGKKIEISNEVFELLTEIKIIGDKNQYEEYLSNIFPNSKVKDILYHGSPSERFEKFTKAGELDGGFFGRGYYFTPSLDLAKEYQKRYKTEGSLYCVLVNLQNPFYWKDNQVNFLMNTFRDIPRENIKIDKDWDQGWEKELVLLYNKTYGENISNISDIEYAQDLNNLAKVGTIFLKSKKHDGSIAKNPQSKKIEYCVFDSDNIYILGSKQDIDGFKNFVGN